MYKGLHFILLVFVSVSVSAAEYFSQGSGSPNQLTSWNTQPSGGGTSPSNFSTNGDVFIIQTGHELVTTAVWTLSGNNTVLRISQGGSLQANHSIVFSGIFEIADGAIYIHNHRADSGNDGFVDAERGIFSGENRFSSRSTVEIRNWSSSNTWLPLGVEWGNLIINYTNDIGGDWNQNGSLEVVSGNLVIRSTGPASNRFALTGEGSMLSDIGGNLVVEGGNFVVKTGNIQSNSSKLTVVGDIMVLGGVFNLGTTDFLPNNEVYLAGDLNISPVATFSSENLFSILIFNGAGRQSINAISPINASLKILPGSEVVLAAHLTMGAGNFFIISGTFEAGSFDLDLSDVELFVAGGIFNSNGVIYRKSGRTAICTGNGNFVPGAFFCGSSGSKGRMNLNGAFVLLNQSVMATFSVGQMGSPGDLYMENASTLSFSDENLGSGGTVELGTGSVLSIDESSLIEGQATYYGRGGRLIIGSPDGISMDLPSGNITVTVNRFYDAENINSFEYRSAIEQSTGNGLPETIRGSFSINNSSADGVVLSRATTVSAGGQFNLINGRLVTVGNILVTLDAGAILTGGSATAFIDGPLRRIGSGVILFPVGKMGIYSPVQITEVSGGQQTDIFRVEYFPGSPQAQFGNNLRVPLHHISSVEYWSINRESGDGRKSVRLSINERSHVNDFSSLTLANYIEGLWQEVPKSGFSGTTSSGTVSFSTPFFGNFTLASTNAQNPLPLHILAFKAEKVGSGARISWEIADGDTPAGFEVLYSNDNQNFKSIGSVESIDGQLNYQFVHYELAAGANYYRLQAIDIDGSSKLSKIAVLFNKQSGGLLVQLYPSVVRTFTNLSIQAATPGLYQLVITNSAGQVAHRRQFSLKEGDNNLPLELGELPAGIYNLSVIMGQQTINTIRFIKSGN